jgi:hypothetical protein
MQADPKAKAQTLTATLSLSSISLNTMRVCSRIQHESTTRTRKTQTFNPTAQEQNRDEYLQQKSKQENHKQKTDITRW